MTIDEAIIIIKKVIGCDNEEHRNCLDNVCEECEHNYKGEEWTYVKNHLAEWLEELLELRKLVKSSAFQDGCEAGKEEAIDFFANLACYELVKDCEGCPIHCKDGEETACDEMWAKWLREKIDKKKSSCAECILDNTDACQRGAGRAVDDEIRYSFLKAEIADNLYEKTRNAIMKSWDSAVVGLGQKRRGQLNAMFTILLDNIEYIFKY